MATYLCWSGGTGADGTQAGGWAAAYTNLQSALSGKSGADIILVHTGASSTHNYNYNTTSGITLAGPSSGSPITIIGVDKDAGTGFDTYSISSTVNERNDGTGGDLILDGSLEAWGIYFQSDDNLVFSTGDSNEAANFYSCTFKTVSAGTGDMGVNSYGGNYWGCTFLPSKNFTVSNYNSFYGGTVNTSGSGLILQNGDFSGVDFSANAASSNFIVSGATPAAANFIGCLYHTSVSYASGTINDFKVNGSDVSGGDWFSYQIKKGLAGAVTLSDSVYRDTTGNTYDGTNEYSLCYEQPSANLVLRGDWNNYFIDTTGTYTVTAEIANATGNLTDKQVWLEVEYFANSGDAKRKFLTDFAGATTTYPRGNPVASATNQAASSETWTGIAETAQKLSVSVTINKIGFLRWRVCTQTTTTLYVCPAISVV
jgi:hypothetical protein